MKIIVQDIERIYTELNQLKIYLLKHNNDFHYNTVTDHDRKILLLAIASFFERKVSTRLLEYIDYKTNNNSLIANLIQRKVLDRKYHTLFEWKEKNINSFLAIFGKDFKFSIENKIKDMPELNIGMKAFLQLGRLRNDLVHEDFATNKVGDKTMSEVYELFKIADQFIDFLFSEVNSY